MEVLCLREPSVDKLGQGSRMESPWAYPGRPHYSEPSNQRRSGNLMVIPSEQSSSLNWYEVMWSLGYHSSTNHFKWSYKSWCETWQSPVLLLSPIPQPQEAVTFILFSLALLFTSTFLTVFIHCYFSPLTHPSSWWTHSSHHIFLSFVWGSFVLASSSTLLANFSYTI